MGECKTPSVKSLSGQQRLYKYRIFTISKSSHFKPQEFILKGLGIYTNCKLQASYHPRNNLPSFWHVELNLQELVKDTKTQYSINLKCWRLRFISVLCQTSKNVRTAGLSWSMSLLSVTLYGLLKLKHVFISCCSNEPGCWPAE